MSSPEKVVFADFFFDNNRKTEKKSRWGGSRFFLFLTKAAAHRLKGRPSTGRLKNKLIFFSRAKVKSKNFCVFMLARRNDFRSGGI